MVLVHTISLNIVQHMTTVKATLLTIFLSLCGPLASSTSHIRAQHCLFLYIVQYLSCWPSSLSFLLSLNMIFGRITSALTTCPNHQSFPFLTISSSVPYVPVFSYRVSRKLPRGNPVDIYRGLLLKYIHLSVHQISPKPLQL